MHDGPDAEIDDYDGVWRLELEPINANACPLEIVVGKDEANPVVGFSCESWARIAKRHSLSLGWLGQPYFVGFGVEPYLPLEDVLAAANAIVAGDVQLQVNTIGRSIVGTVGRILLDGGVKSYPGVRTFPAFPCMGIGRRAIHSYEPWTKAGPSAS